MQNGMQQYMAKVKAKWEELLLIGDFNKHINLEVMVLTEESIHLYSTDRMTNGPFVLFLSFKNIPIKPGKQIGKQRKIIWTT